jgi:hypothetical protein
VSTATTATARAREREWWRRAAVVLHSPRAVFAALRDESEAARQARQEPVTALVFVGALAAVLATPAFGRLLDDSRIDGVVVVVLALAAAGIYGFFGYWVLGAALYLGTRLAGGADFRRARHILAFAAAPLALSLLVVWPLRLAFYGGDVFRSGGDDSSTGGRVLGWLELGFVAWALALLVVGVREAHRWRWGRATLASVPAAALPAIAVGVGILHS